VRDVSREDRTCLEEGRHPGRGRRHPSSRKEGIGVEEEGILPRGRRGSVSRKEASFLEGGGDRGRGRRHPSSRKEGIGVEEEGILAQAAAREAVAG
jgi:hypothetical protein